jgi:hypothetical protein
MLKDIVEARPLDSYRVWLRFEDGVEGVVDLEQQLSFKGVFAPLRERAYFLQVRVNSEHGTIAWPNGADLDPDVLYAQVAGKTIDTSSKQPANR